MTDQSVELYPHKVVARVSRLAETRNYNHKLLNIPEAWKASKGKGILVGILDTGQPMHDDVVIEKSWTAFDEYVLDANGHGTHVAGLIGARENGRGVLGIAPECSINTYTVLDKDGIGGIYGIASAITQACEDGCDIINMSLGIGGPADVSLLRTACQVAASEGRIIVAAAGNEAGAIDQPARYDFVIAVGAVDQNKKHAGFSNHGPQLDFAVGGVDVYSTWLDNGYAKLSGTSMACPVFAGICALILGEHRAREEAGDTVNTPIGNVQEMIEHVKRFAFDVGPEGFDNEFGFGIPIFHGPDEKPVASAKDVLKSELDTAIECLEAAKAAIDGLEL